MFGEEDYWRDLHVQSVIAMGNHYDLLSEIAERPHIKYKPALFKDGDMWCALYGKDIQSGIVGFGKSPELAMIEFDKNWR